MICKRLYALIALLISTLLAQSQFNDSTFHHIGFSATGIVNKTNEVSSYVLSNAFRYNISRKDVRLNLNSSWLYGQQQKQLTNNDFSSSLDFNLYKTLPHFYYWGLANFDKSYSLKIISRYQVGLGGAYNLVDKSTAWFNLSDGILYEGSNVKSNDTVNTKDNVFRNSFRIRYKLVFADVMELNGTNLLQNALKKDNDYIINLTNSLSFKLRKWLSLVATLNYNKVTQTHRDNLLLTVGLSAEKYF